MDHKHSKHAKFSCLFKHTLFMKFCWYFLVFVGIWLEMHL
jgi:hypothetical protein